MFYKHKHRRVSSGSTVTDVKSWTRHSVQRICISQILLPLVMKLQLQDETAGSLFTENQRAKRSFYRSKTFLLIHFRRERNTGTLDILIVLAFLCQYINGFQCRRNTYRIQRHGLYALKVQMFVHRDQNKDVPSIVSVGTLIYTLGRISGYKSTRRDTEDA